MGGLIPIGKSRFGSGIYPLALPRQGGVLGTSVFFFSLPRSRECPIAVRSECAAYVVIRAMELLRENSRAGRYCPYRTIAYVIAE